MNLRDALEMALWEKPVVVTLKCPRSGARRQFRLYDAWDEFVFMVLWVEWAYVCTLDWETDRKKIAERVRYLTNLRVDYYRGRVSDIIDMAFPWSESPSGHEVWRLIYNMFRGVTADAVSLNDILESSVFSTEVSFYPC